MDLLIPDIFMGKLHPFCQQQDIVDYCRAHSIVIQAYSPLRRGIGLEHPTITAIANKVSCPRNLLLNNFSQTRLEIISTTKTELKFL